MKIVKILPLFSALILFALVFATKSTYAERRPDPLEKGMSYQEVLDSWGNPAEKIEYESKREVLWQYEHGEVNFKQGKVLSWKQDLLPHEIEAAKEPEPAVPEVNPAGDDDPDKTYAVEEILDELLKKTPQNDKKK